MALQTKLELHEKSLAAGRYAGFDIETIDEFPDGSDWQDHLPIRVSCAALHKTGFEPETTYYYPGRHKGLNPGVQGDGLEEPEINSIVGDLLRCHEYGWKVATWNGVGFDFPILMHQFPKYAEQLREIALDHIDMMFNVVCIRGHFLGLARVLRAYDAEKVEDVNGAIAPALWRDDNEKLVERGAEQLTSLSAVEKREKVIRYVIGDAQLQGAVALLGDRDGRLKWITQKGALYTFEMHEGRWLTVRECLSLPALANPLVARHVIAKRLDIS